MSGKLRFLAVAGGILAVVAVAVLLLVQNLDPLIKHAIETYGSATAGTAVRVSEVRITLREGRGTLRGLTVANPPGYSATPLFSLDDISVRLDTATLASDVPVIDELRVGATAFRYEIGQDGQSNLKTVQRHLKQAKADPSREADTRAERRFRIRRLVIADGEATLDLGRFGAGQAAARVPGVTLTDLGGTQGMTQQELAKTVLDALVKNLERSVADAGLQKLLKGKNGSKVDEAIKGLLNR